MACPPALQTMEGLPSELTEDGGVDLTQLPLLP